MTNYLKKERHTIFVAARAVRNELEARDKADPKGHPMRHDWRDALSMARKDTDSIDAAKVVLLAAFAAGVRNPLQMHVLRRKLGEGERLAHLLGAEAQDRSPVSADLLAMCDAAVEAHASALARPRHVWHRRATTCPCCAAPSVVSPAD